MKVKCSECGKEYQLKSDEKPSDFQCTCGGELKPEKQAFPENEPLNKPDKPSKSSSGSIFNDWKKQYLILIIAFILVFLVIAFDGAVVFEDLVVTNVTAPSSGVRGNEITLNTTIKNNGFLSSGGFNVTFHLTPEKSFNNRDSVFLGKIRVNNLIGGETMQPDPQFTIPTNITPGNYYIRVFIDSNKEIPESDEKNDVMYSSTKITIQ